MLQLTGWIQANRINNLNKLNRSQISHRLR